MCICLYVYVYVYMYMFMFICICLCLYVYVYVYVIVLFMDDTWRAFPTLLLHLRLHLHEQNMLNRIIEAIIRNRSVRHGLG